LPSLTIHSRLYTHAATTCIPVDMYIRIVQHTHSLHRPHAHTYIYTHTHTQIQRLTQALSNKTSPAAPYVPNRSRKRNKILQSSKRRNAKREIRARHFLSCPTHVVSLDAMTSPPLPAHLAVRFESEMQASPKPRTAQMRCGQCARGKCARMSCGCTLRRAFPVHAHTTAPTQPSSRAKN